MSMTAMFAFCGSCCKGNAEEHQVSVEQQCALVGQDKNPPSFEDNGAEFPASYQGQWQGEYYHGYGILCRSDGSKYEGNFCHGRAHGLGQFLSKNGNYQGQWEHDQAHGYGTYRFQDGEWYEGEWHYDQKQGKGTHYWTDGSRYEGQFQKGCKDGDGAFYSATGVVVYTGQFVGDKMEGDGTYRFANGRVYVGQWSQGQTSGHGIMQWPDGSKYTGSFKKHFREGEGCMVWPDGRTYTGQWSKGKQDGVGVVHDGAGTERRICWKNGVEVSYPEPVNDDLSMDSTAGAQRVNNLSQLDNRQEPLPPQTPTALSPAFDAIAELEKTSPPLTDIPETRLK